MAETKKFLDSTGLTLLWGKIKENFVSNVSAGLDATNGFTVAYTKNGADTSVTIPYATTTQGGLMTKDQAETVANFSAGVDAIVPFVGLQVKGADTTISSRKANIDLVYSSTNKTISIVDKNNSDNVLTSISTADFVKDGMLSEAELVTNPTDQAAGTYIKLTWNTEGGKDPMFINVTSLIDTYNAGNGLTLDNKSFSIKLDKANGEYLTVGTDGLAVATALWTKVGELDAATLNAAKSDATTKANAAQSAAVTAAAADAKSKADAAKSEAISSAVATAKTHTDTVAGAYADAANGVNASGLRKEIAERDAATLDAAKSDATTKANAAQSAAVTAAAADAKLKADAAKEAAIASAKEYTETTFANFVALTKDEIDDICVL